MPRARDTWRWAAQLAFSLALSGCEQTPDLVVSATPVEMGVEDPDAVDDPDAGNGVMPDPDSGTAMMEPPPVDSGDANACRNLTRVYFELNKIWTSEPDRCVWSFDDSGAAELLLNTIFAQPPAQLDFEQERASVCEALPNVFQYAYPTPDGWRMCAGYCKALGIWIAENDPLVDACLADGGSF
jgi:hypothetical protein